MTTRLEFKAKEADASLRADSFLARESGLTRSAVIRLMEEGRVTLGGMPVRKNHRVSPEEVFVILLPPPRESDVRAQDIPLDILYEDADLLVINKPRGMVVHPAAGHSEGTLVNALLMHCGDSLSGIGGVMRPGIVHRLDRDTSGLMLAAKSDFGHISLAAQIKAHTVRRVYEAVVCGNIKEDAGRVDAPIGRHHTDRKKMAVTSKNARSAVTHYEVIGRYPGFTHVRCILETGRTHQIRVHMAHLGHPVVGDPVYAGKKNAYGLTGQCLHARMIAFDHPRTGQRMEFCTELPAYFAQFLSKIQH